MNEEAGKPTIRRQLRKIASKRCRDGVSAASAAFGSVRLNSVAQLTQAAIDMDGYFRVLVLIVAGVFELRRGRQRRFQWFPVRIL